MSKPLIQIDDNGTTREMTDEEHAFYLQIHQQIVETNDETPSPN